MFKLEELQCALSLIEWDNVYGEGKEGNMSWDEQQTIRALNEEGFELVNKLFMRILEKFVLEEEEKQQQQNQQQDENENIFLKAAVKNVKKFNFVWPELIRLVIIDENQQSLSEEMGYIIHKLSTLTPETFTRGLLYEEKIELLCHLIDLIHETEDFRNFLNSRIEEKSNIYKQKFEIQQEIR